MFEHGRADFGTIGDDAPPSLTALRDLRVTSYLVVPMAAHGLRVGVLTFLTLGGQRPLDSRDVAVAADLAARAAVAVENAPSPPRNTD